MKGLNEINPFTGRSLAPSVGRSVGQVKEISAHSTMGDWNEITYTLRFGVRFGELVLNYLRQLIQMKLDQSTESSNL